MLFEENTFIKNLKQLIHYVTLAERWVENTNDGNIRAINEANKNLMHASKLLQLLYGDILAHKNSWDELTFKQRTGQYDKIFNRYKDIQQQLDNLRPQQKLNY